MLIIGSHVGFKKDKQLLGSLEEAISYGENTFMFYTGAPQNTARSEIDLKIVEEATTMYSVGKVIDQSRAPGTSIVKGSNLTVTIAKAPVVPTPTEDADKDKDKEQEEGGVD